MHYAAREYRGVATIHTDAYAPIPEFVPTAVR